MRALVKLHLLLIGMVAFAATVAGQGTPDSTAVPKYNLSTEVRLRGVVVDINDHMCPISGGLGSHLILQTQEGTIEVHLAPTKFVTEYQLVFARGDDVEVLGARVIFQGKEALLAREIVRGEDTFVFRDANGKPVW